MIISLVAAVSQNGVIGHENRLPWSLPADMAHFRRLTMGHHLVMGRRTFESIGKPLPGRTCMVLSRDPAFGAEGCRVFPDLLPALDFAQDQGETECFIIGGETVYRRAMGLADRMYLTVIHGEFEGDARFPERDCHWELSSIAFHQADDRNRWGYEFRVYDRIREDAP